MNRRLYLLCFASLLLIGQEAFAASEREKEEEAQKTEQETFKKPESASSPKKQKAHFVGVRRPKDKPPQKKKRPSLAVKNQWVKTKTHPKKAQKEESEEEESAPPLDDTPYYNPGGSLSSAMARRASFASDSLLFQEDSKENDTAETEPTNESPLPVLGKDAPLGHVFFTADWLLWRTRQGDMEFAVQGASTSSQTPFPHSAVSRLNFDVQSGFRVGFGVHIPGDGWDIYLNYTDFRPDASKSIDGSIFPLFLYNPPLLAASAHAHWKIEFQELDIEIGRAYYIGNTLSFRPFFGMAGAWIDQRAHIDYTGGSIPFGQTDHIATHNDFKGAGPRAGIGSNWHLGEGLSLFGNLAAALLVGHFDLENHQESGEIETIHLNSDLNLISPVLQLIAGLAWDRNFHRDQRHIGLSAGFETQYWWRQNQLERFTDRASPLFTRADSDLSLYGLTLKARFDF